MDEEDFWEEPEALHDENEDVDLSASGDLYDGYGESGHYGEDDDY